MSRAHVWSGRLAVLTSVPVAVHCLYALGFQATDTRVLFHSLFGCFFYGAFAAKMLLLTRRGLPAVGHPDRRRPGVLRAGLHLADIVLLVLPDQRRHFLDLPPPLRGQHLVHNGLTAHTTRSPPTEEPLMPLDELRQPRRTVIVGTGLGLAATALAGCATYGDEARRILVGTSSAPGGGEGSPAAAETVLAKTADVPVGSGLIVDDVVITQPTAGVFKGFSSVCPHAGCNVSEVTDGNIVCPCHGSRFDLEGAVVKGPAREPLASQGRIGQGRLDPRRLTARMSG